MMKTFVLALLGLACAAGARAADVVEPETAARCEAQVQEALQRVHGKALRGAKFDAASRTLLRAEGDEATLRGAGRTTLDGGGGAFQYSCAVNLKTGQTSGAVVRDAVAQARRARDWEPDLAKVSPADCEAAAAALLTTRHPRIGRITFDAETRRLEPAERERIGLEGRGALQRAAGMLAAPFSYRCEFDGRNGRVVAVRADE
jgi:hypothetical protein